MLIHVPTPVKARAIGVSQYGIEEIEDVLELKGTVPAVNQVKRVERRKTSRI